MKVATRQWTGLAILFGSMAAFFWWGAHFEVFGADFDLVHRPLEVGGFFGWILMTIFGGGFAQSGIGGGLRSAGAVLAMLILAGIVGWLRGAYG